MNLAEKIEHGKIAKYCGNGKSRMKYKRFMKKRQKRIWRRFNKDMQPMYNRFNGWEL